MGTSYLGSQSDPGSDKAGDEVSFQRVDSDIAAERVGFNTGIQFLRNSAFRRTLHHPTIAGGRIWHDDTGTTAEQVMSSIPTHRTAGISSGSEHFLQGVFSYPSVMLNSAESIYDNSSADRGLITASHRYIDSREHGAVPSEYKWQTSRTSPVILDKEADWMIDLYNGVRRQSICTIAHSLTSQVALDWTQDGETALDETSFDFDADVGIDGAGYAGGPFLIVQHEDNGNYNSQIKVLSKSIPTTIGMKGVAPRTIVPVRPKNVTWLAEWDGTNLRSVNFNTHPMPPTFVWGNSVTEVGKSHSLSMPSHPTYASSGYLSQPDPVGIKLEAYALPPGTSSDYDNWVSNFLDFLSEDGSTLGAPAQETGTWSDPDNGEARFMAFGISTHLQTPDGTGSYPHNQLKSWLTDCNFADAPAVEHSRSGMSAAGVIRNIRGYARGSNDNLNRNTSFNNAYDALTDSTSGLYIDDLTDGQMRQLTGLVGLMKAIKTCIDDTSNVWSMQWHINAGTGTTWNVPRYSTGSEYMAMHEIETGTQYGTGVDRPSATISVTLSKVKYEEVDELAIWKPVEMATALDHTTSAAVNFGDDQKYRNCWLPQPLDISEDFGHWKVSRKAGSHSHYLVGWVYHPDDNTTGVSNRTIRDVVIGYDFQDTLWRKFKLKDWWTSLPAVDWNGSHALEDMSLAAFLVTPLRTVSGFTSPLCLDPETYYQAGSPGDEGHWSWQTGSSHHNHPPFNQYDYGIHKDRQLVSTTDNTNWGTNNNGHDHHRSENRYLQCFQGSYGHRSSSRDVDAFRYELVTNTVTERNEIKQHVQWGKGPGEGSWISPGQNLFAMNDVNGEFLSIDDISSLDALNVSTTCFLFWQPAGSVGVEDAAVNDLFKGKLMTIKSFEGDSEFDNFRTGTDRKDLDVKRGAWFKPRNITWNALSKTDKVFDSELEVRGQGFKRVIETSTVRKPLSVIEEPYSLMVTEGYNSAGFLDLQWVRDALNASLFDGLISRINSAQINFPEYEGTGESIVNFVEDGLNRVFDSIKWIVTTILDQFDNSLGFLISQITRIIEYGINDKLVPWLDQKVASLVDELGKSKNWMLMLFRFPIPVIPFVQMLVPTLWVSFGFSDHPTKDGWNSATYTAGRSRTADISKIYAKGRTQRAMQLWTYGSTQDWYNSDERRRPIMIADLGSLWTWLFESVSTGAEGHVTPFSKIKITRGMGVPDGIKEYLPTRLWLGLPVWMRPINVDESKIAIPGSHTWDYEEGFAQDEAWEYEPGLTTYQYADAVKLTMDLFYYIFVLAVIGLIAYVVRSPRVLVPLLTTIIGKVPSVYGALQTRAFRGETKTKLATFETMLSDLDKYAKGTLSSTEFNKASFALIKQLMASALEALGALARAMRGKSVGSDLLLIRELTKLSSPGMSNLQKALSDIQKES